MVLSLVIFISSCDEHTSNNTALKEQELTEQNQTRLNSKQPAPKVTYSLERENLIKRFQLMNDRSVVMYMYVFNWGVATPIGYYQVNKVSSVNSQLTNPNQIITRRHNNVGDRYSHVLPSPAEDGSYGTNGNAVFGITPEKVYLEHNLGYIVATVPLNLKTKKLAVIDITTAKELEELFNRLDRE